MILSDNLQACRKSPLQNCKGPQVFLVLSSMSASHEEFKLAVPGNIIVFPINLNVLVS